MAEPRIDATGTPEGDGLFAHISALFAAQLSYLKVRLQLAGIEAKEAGIHYGLILAFAVIALIAIIFGYLFLIIALVFLIALAFHSQSISAARVRCFSWRKASWPRRCLRKPSTNSKRTSDG